MAALRYPVEAPKPYPELHQKSRSSILSPPAAEFLFRLV